MEDFNWTDSEAVIIRSVAAVAVYINTNDDLVIRQQSPYPDEDVLVIIPSKSIPNLIKAFRLAVKK